MEQNNLIAFKKKFETYTGSRFEICYDIYTGLTCNNETDPVELFIYACNSFGIIPSDGSFSPSNSGISQNEIDELKDTYGETVDALLDAFLQRAIKANMPANDFYTNVWNLIIQNPIFPTDKEKVFALYYVLIDSRIPYYPINPGLEMNNVEYRAIVEKCKDDLNKVRFVLAVDFSQKTMEASNLLDILLAQSDYKVQTVIMSRIITELRDKNKKLLDTLLEKVKEDD